MAVIAAFAMLFAASAVFISGSADDVDATSETAIEGTLTELNNDSTDLSELAKGKYFASEDITVKAKSGTVAGDVIIYVLKGVTVTLTQDSTAGLVVLYAAVDGSVQEDGTVVKPTFYATGLSVANATGGSVVAKAESSLGATAFLVPTASVANVTYVVSTPGADPKTYYYGQDVVLKMAGDADDESKTVSFKDLASAADAYFVQIDSQTKNEINKVKISGDNTSVAITLKEATADVSGQSVKTYKMTVDDVSSSTATVQVVSGKVSAPADTTLTIVGVSDSNETVSSVNVWHPSIMEVVSNGVLSAATKTVTVSGDQTITSKVTILGTVSVSAGVKLTINDGVEVLNHGTISGAGTLQNYGKLKNGAGETGEDGAIGGTIEITTFNNGSDAIAGTPAVPAKSGIFENYASSTVSSSAILNSETSTFTVCKGSTLTVAAANTNTITNNGYIVNNGTMTFGTAASSTYNGLGTITNNGVMTFDADITAKVKADGSETLTQAKAAVLTNNKTLTISGIVGLYIVNNDSLTLTATAQVKYFVAVSDTNTITPVSGYVTKSSTNAIFFAGELLETEINLTVDNVKAGPIAADGDGFRVFNSDVKTEMYLKANGANVVYAASGFTVDGGVASGNVPAGNLYSANATIDITMIGANIADVEATGIIQISADKIENGAVVTIDGYGIIASDLGLSKTGQIVIPDNTTGHVYIYGTLWNSGLATSTAGFINDAASSVTTTVKGNLDFMTNATSSAPVDVGSQQAILDAADSGVKEVKTTGDLTLSGAIILSDVTIIIKNGSTVTISNEASLEGVTFIKEAGASTTATVKVGGAVSFTDVSFQNVIVKTIRAASEGITAETTNAVFNGVTGSGSLSVGSLVITGDYDVAGTITSEDGTIVIGAPGVVTRIDGTSVDPNIIDIENLVINGEVIFSNISIEVGTSFVATQNAKVSGPNGLIVIGQGASIAVSSDAEVARALIDNTANPKLTINSQSDLLGGIDYYETFQLGDENVTLLGVPNDTLTIGKKTIILNGKDLIIAGDVAFNETTVTEYGGAVTGGSLKVTDDRTASLTLTDANIFATVVDEDDNITIASALVSAWGQDSAQTIMVGYGNTLNMDSVKIVSGQEIAIYGILNNKGTTSVSAGASIVIKAGAVANNTGTMTILGDVDVYGIFNNSGVVTVGDNNGNAKVTVDGDGKLVLKDGSSMTVKALKAAEGYNNELAGTGKVTVDVGAVLTINGLISVKDVALKGTFAMNGEANNTTVQIFDGITVSVTSVDGTIKFSDAGIVDDDVKKENEEGVLVQKPNTILYDGNLVILTDVKGVTVSEAVKVGSVKIDEDNCKYYLCQMTVSGAVTEIKDADGTAKVKVYQTAAPSEFNHANYSTSNGVGKVIIDDLTLGKDVGLETAGTVLVNGTITAVEEDSYVALGTGDSDMVTVSGLIVILDDEPLVGNISAAMYNLVNVEKGETTYYYTTFTEAIKAAETSYENTVILYGSITISSSATIAKPIVVELASGATVTVKSAADVVFEDGSKFDAFNAKKVTVSGTLTIIDKDTGIIEPSVKDNFYYEVLLTDVDAPQKVVYAGLVGVLKNAEAGQTVTMQKNSAIFEDLEIKEGVTLVVPEKLVLTIGSKTKEITITVNGTIQVLKNANIVSAANTKKITIVDNGVISSYNDDEYSDIRNLSMTNYAEFNIDDKVYYRSNIAYAAENCHEGTIKVIGQVSAGDLVFTKDEKATGLTVRVVTENPGGGVINTNLYASSIILDQAVLYIDANSKVTGEIIAASIGGDASIEFDGVSNITVESYYDDVKEEDHMYIYGVPTGTITIATGNVEVKDVSDNVYDIVSADLIVYNSTEHAVKLVVLDKATFTVPKSASLITVDALSRYGQAMIVEGTFDVKSGAVTINDMYLTGTMNVEGDKTNIYDSVIAGTLDVKEKTETTAEGLATVGYVKIGDVPTSLGAAGTVVGKVNIYYGYYIYVYEGSDVSKAKINYNLAEQKNGSKSTVVNINGTDFVTVYSNGTVNLYTALNVLDIQLYGLEEPEFDSDMNMYSAATLKTEDKISNADRVTIGQYDKVYFDIDVVGIRGMISEGQGVIMFIDGNTIDNYYVSSGNLGNYVLPVGTYKVTYEPAYGYEDKGIKITFNGSVVTDGKITVTADMKTFTLTVSDATPADPVTPITPVDPSQPEKDDGMGITEYLLIVLVILAAILVVVVAIRMMRN